MLQYDIFGTINTVFIFVSLLGVYSQLRTLWQRKAAGEAKVSELLSLNQFSVSFLAYFSFFVFGYSITPFNHYIVWPRLIASLFVLGILIEIWKDRHNRRSAWACSIAVVLLVIGIAGLFFGERYEDQSRAVSQSLIVVITLLLAQGYWHQISLIIRSRSTGAVDLKMSQFILMMDISTIAFALSMGLTIGWPLLMLAFVSGTTKLIIMYLFRWVRLQQPLIP